MTSTALACTVKNYLRVVENLTADLRIKTLDKQSMKIVIEFIKNLRPMIIDKNTIWVSGD